MLTYLKLGPKNWRALHNQPLPHASRFKLGPVRVEVVSCPDPTLLRGETFLAGRRARAGHETRGGGALEEVNRQIKGA